MNNNDDTRKSLNDYLKVLDDRTKRDSIGLPAANIPGSFETEIGVGGEKSKLDLYKPTTASPEPEPTVMGFLNRIKQSSLRNKKQLEASRLMFDTQITLLKHQSDGKIRESEAFWNAKSAEIKETIGNYIREVFAAIEVMRMGGRQAALQRAYEVAAKQLGDVASHSTLPEQLRIELLDKMRQQLNNTVEMLMSDGLAKQYGL